MRKLEAQDEVIWLRSCCKEEIKSGILMWPNDYKRACALHYFIPCLHSIFLKKEEKAKTKLLLE